VATTTSARTYKIDKSHSEAVFQVRHLVTKVRGRFSDFEGTIVLDEASPEASSVEFTIQATSIDTNEPDRDKHLRSEDFFAVEQFKTITFKSKRITKEVTLPVTHLGKIKDPWGNEKIGFETELTLNRKDFGLKWNAPLETGGFLVGDEVKVSLSIQAFGQ